MDVGNTSSLWCLTSAVGLLSVAVLCLRSVNTFGPWCLPRAVACRRVLGAASCFRYFLGLWCLRRADGWPSHCQCRTVSVTGCVLPHPPNSHFQPIVLTVSVPGPGLRLGFSARVLLCPFCPFTQHFQARGAYPGLRLGLSGGCCARFQYFQPMVLVPRAGDVPREGGVG